MFCVRHHSLQCFPAVVEAVPAPHCHAACEQALHCAPVDVGDDAGVHAFSLHRSWQACLTPVMGRVQILLCENWGTLNFKLLYLSIPHVTEDVSVLTLPPKVHYYLALFTCCFDTSCSVLSPPLCRRSVTWPRRLFHQETWGWSTSCISLSHEWTRSTGGGRGHNPEWLPIFTTCGLLAKDSNIDSSYTWEQLQYLWLWRQTINRQLILPRAALLSQ